MILYYYINVFHVGIKERKAAHLLTQLQQINIYKENFINKNIKDNCYNIKVAIVFIS